MAYGAILGQRFDGYTREETLDDQIKTLLGLSTDATPSEAFLALYLKGESSILFGITVLQPNGKPWANLALSGVTNINGEAVTTNENGYALCKADSSNPTITATSNYINVNNINQKLSKDENFITQATIQSSYNNGTIRITSYRKILSSEIADGVKTIDFTVVGGGAAGYSVANNRPGAGGGGGYVVTELNKDYSQMGSYIEVGIGSGGRYSTTNAASTIAGQNSYVKGENSEYLNIVANGAKSQTGNGNGGNAGDGGSSAGYEGQNGGNGTGYIFNESSLGLAGGGGGGGGADYSDADPFSGGKGGSPKGGKGGDSDENGSNGTTPGGGGGGGGFKTRQNPGHGGNGGDGMVYMRFNH